MRQFELTKSFLEELSLAVESNDLAYIAQVVHPLHPADIAEIFDQLETEEAIFILRTLEEEQAADTLTHLDEEVRDLLLGELSSEEIAEQVENMDSDDAADLLADLDTEKLREVISHVEDTEHSSDISQLLSYPEGTAGALMATEFISAKLDWPVNRCIVEMRRQAEAVERVFTVYVIDDAEKLVGTLSLKSLLFAAPKTQIKDLYQAGAMSVKALDDAEEAARIMEKYDLVALPVVDDYGRLIGRITVDDAMDLIREEAEKDMARATGLSADVDNTDSMWRITRARLPWLLVAMGGGILGSGVISQYETELQLYPEMAMFIPLIAAMGGNVGIQSSAIVVKGLASKTIQLNGMLGQITKELGVGLLNGLLCAGIILAYNILVNDNLNLAITVATALLSVIIFAAGFGTFIPLMLNKYKIDPAVATGPFITTTNDILGVFIYFLIGQAMYGI
jgi:magnesium transporter